MPATVTVVGDALLDVVAIPGAPLRRGADVPGRVSAAPGGQGANLAVRLARRGVDVTLVTGLAADAAGDLIAARLRDEGVGLDVRPVTATGAVLVLLDGAGERTMLSQRVPFSEHLLDDPPRMADWLVVSGYVLLESQAVAAAAAVRETAPRRLLVGCSVPEGVIPHWRAAAAALDPALVVLNRDEVEHLGGELADRVVVTSSDGAEATVAGATARVASPPRAAVVDATGAGDAFAATLLAELLEAWPPAGDRLRSALEAAAGVAAAVTQVPGAQGRIAAETEARLRT